MFIVVLTSAWHIIFCQTAAEVPTASPQAVSVQERVRPKPDVCGFSWWGGDGLFLFAKGSVQANRFVDSCTISCLFAVKMWSRAWGAPKTIPGSKLMKKHP
jgi:hypothetical protein